MSKLGINKTKEPPALCALRNRLSAYVFTTKGPDASPLQKQIMETTRAKHMAFWMGGTCLSAYLHYGEKHRTIALKKDVGLDSVGHIGRIADAACMFFWKHRKRCGDIAKQLNFSVESATADLKNETGLREIFEQMEKEIIRIAWFSDLKEDAPVNKILLLEDRIAALEKSNAAQGIEIQEIKRAACPIVSYPGPVVPPPSPPSDDTNGGFGYNVTIFDKPTTL